MAMLFCHGTRTKTFGLVTRFYSSLLAMHSLTILFHPIQAQQFPEGLDPRHEPDHSEVFVLATKR